MEDNNNLEAMMMSLVNSNEGTRETIIKAPFKYPGCKERLLSLILPQLPYRERFCEVFGGTGSVILNRQPSSLDVFNDRNSGISDFYICLRDFNLRGKLKEALEEMVHSRELFLYCRDTWEKQEDIVERAARWYHSIEFSFAGKGQSFGRATKSSGGLTRSFHRGIGHLDPIHERFKHIQIENLDWRQMFLDYDDENTVWYLDPPYMTEFKQYKHWMTKAEHVEMLYRIFQLSGFVAISGYPSPEYEKMPWDHIEKWLVEDTFQVEAYDANNCKLAENKTDHGKVWECLYIKD